MNGKNMAQVQSPSNSMNELERPCWVNLPERLIYPQENL